MKVAIGVCARNEEACIIQTLDSILVSAARIENLDWSLFVCANGCTDTTVDLVRSWWKGNPGCKGTLVVLDQANLVEAQREIVNISKAAGYSSIIFFDADVVVDPLCIGALLNAAQADEVQAVYAVSVPITRDKRTLIERALNQYDLSSSVFTERKHLHGRGFLIKDWYIPMTSPKLVADDMYLSFSLLKKYGPQSIKKVPSAKVYFRQIISFTDFYKAYRRRSIELNKCLALFPEFKLLPADQINRRILWKKLFSESSRRLLLWFVLFFFKLVSRIRYAFEKNISEEWIPTDTSKRTKYRPILVLVEGLDCSGKKTVSRILQQKFLDAGISCRVNKGPLNSRGYRALSRLVSLYPFPNVIRSLVYSLEGIGEKEWFRYFSTQVVVQISSPYRNWAYAHCNKSHLRIFISQKIKRFIAHYDFIFFLTAPYGIRLQRHAAQVSSGENPDHIEKRFFGEQKFNEMEFILKNLFKVSNPIDAEFDSSIQSSVAIATDIFSRVVIKIPKTSDIV